MPQSDLVLVVQPGHRQEQHRRRPEVLRDAVRGAQPVPQPDHRRAQVIAEIVEIAKAIREQRKRSEETGLTENELAFYDALQTNESARLAMQDEIFRKIAHELIEIVRNDAKTDWQVKETVRAKLRIRIKRLLLQHGYPPDQEPTATDLILQQAEMMVKPAN